jgi:hypothetical protein
MPAAFQCAIMRTILPHGSANPFVPPESKVTLLPKIEMADRDHLNGFRKILSGTTSS